MSTEIAGTTGAPFTSARAAQAEMQALTASVTSAEWFDVLDDLDAFVGVHQVGGRTLRLKRRSDGWLVWAGVPPLFAPPLTAVLGGPDHWQRNRLNPAHHERHLPVEEFIVQRRIRWLDAGATDRAVPLRDVEFLEALTRSDRAHRSPRPGEVTRRSIVAAGTKSCTSRRRPRTMRSGTHIVVGDAGGFGTIALDEWLAYDLAQFHYAAQRASTWGEFERYAPQRHILAALDRFELMGQEAFDDDEGNASVTLRRSWQSATPTTGVLSRDGEWFEAPFGKHETRSDDTFLDGRRIPRTIRRPHPGTPFDANEHLGVNDCSYPEWPEQEMLSLVPEEILVQFDCVATSVHDGKFASVQPEQCVEFVAALVSAGFICERQDWLVEAAKGLVDRWPDDT